jgi:predicted CXXCH cytochrome family protein
MSPGIFRAAALVSGAVALFTLIVPGEAGAAETVFLSPTTGSHLTVARVPLLGRLPGGWKKPSFSLNGKPLAAVKMRGDAFSAILQPAAGENVVEISAGAEKARLVFSWGGKNPGRPGYRYHAPVTKEDCGGCHPGGGAGRAPAAACAVCHGKRTEPFPHGPVASGECVSCHDPHGSVNPSLERVPGRKGCLLCHDQSSSRAHVDGAQNADCVKCHDPHGGKDRLFLKK